MFDLPVSWLVGGSSINTQIELQTASCSDPKQMLYHLNVNHVVWKGVCTRVAAGSGQSQLQC